MSVVKKIETIESSIAVCEEKLDQTERSLRLKDLTTEERIKLQKEEKICKAELEELRGALRHNRLENMKSMLLSVLILATAFAFYMLFST